MSRFDTDEQAGGYAPRTDNERMREVFESEARRMKLSLTGLVGSPGEYAFCAGKAWRAFKAGVAYARANESR